MREKEMPRVSVIVPGYNVEKYLARCLDSIINQTYKNLEIICINDGSTDNSLKILKDYAQKDERIQVIDRKNGGQSAARNNGLDVATGEYCYFVDSDDWIELCTIEKLVKIITTHDVDFVEHSLINVPENSSCIAMTKAYDNWVNSYDKSEGINNVPIDINRKILQVAWNKLYKMDIINKFHCRFAEGLINEDELFVWEYGIHCKNYYYLNEKLYNYIHHADSTMETRFDSPKCLDRLEIERKIFRVVEKYKNIEDYKEYLICNYIGTAKCLFSRIPDEYRDEALKKVKEYYETVIQDKRILKVYWRCKYKCLNEFLRILQNISKNIFSIRNERKNGIKRKVITLLGIKLKLRKNV